MNTEPREPMIPLAKLCQEYLAARPNPNMLRRWRAEGLLTPAGVRVKLFSRRVGGRWCATRSAWEAFHAALNGDDLVPPPEPGPNQRELDRRTKIALAECERMGVKLRRPQG